MKNTIYLFAAMVFCLGFCRCSNDDDEYDPYPRDIVLGEYTGTCASYTFKDDKVAEKASWEEEITAKVTPMEKIDKNFIMTLTVKGKKPYAIACNGYRCNDNSASFAIEYQNVKVEDVEYIITGHQIKVEENGPCDGLYTTKTKTINMALSMKKKNPTSDDFPSVIKFTLTKK